MHVYLLYYYIYYQYIILITIIIYLFIRLQEVKFKEGRPVLLLELSRASPAATSAEVAQLARSFEASGADALVVLTDAAETSTGLADLFSVCRAVRIPVVRRDWFLHPLQVGVGKSFYLTKDSLQMRCATCTCCTCSTHCR